MTVARGLATRTTRTGAREFTIQEFVARPLLLPDRSYTHSVRVYALVLGLDPMVALVSPTFGHAPRAVRVRAIPVWRAAPWRGLHTDRESLLRDYLGGFDLQFLVVSVLFVVRFPFRVEDGVSATRPALPAGRLGLEPTAAHTPGGFNCPAERPHYFESPPYPPRHVASRRRRGAAIL